MKSDIPTLILSGEIDAYVPTPWARAMLANMPRAFVLEVKGAGHGPGFSDCGQKVAFEFFNDPTGTDMSKIFATRLELTCQG